MTGSGLSAAKVVLLAVQLANKADIRTLRTLVSQNPKTLHTELLLRIILSHLPESVESSEYVPLIEDLISGALTHDTEEHIDASTLNDLNDNEAKTKVRKLHLLHLIWPDAPADAPHDLLPLFLIHRSILVDRNTGLLNQLPALLTPFFQYSPYLRTWAISTVLPLLRLNFEYYPEQGIFLTIPKFELLDDRAGVSFLLSRTQAIAGDSDANVGRDIRGLTGPWLYGDTRWKRRKIHENTAGVRSNQPSSEGPSPDDKYVGWEEVFKWLTRQAGSSWRTAIQAINQWDGPGDVDLGGYEDGTVWLEEEDQEHLERRYARAAIATAYLISESSEDALNGVQQILHRIITLMDKDRLPTLQQAAALLAPVSRLSSHILSSKNTSFLRNKVLEEQNILTKPNDESIKFLHALLTSAFLCTRAGSPLSIRQAGQLALLQDEHEQRLQFDKLMSRVKNGPKGDDKYWIRMRSELLWLRDWGADELPDQTQAEYGRGVLATLPVKYVEIEILNALLDNTRFTLARSIYESSPQPPLSRPALHDTIIAAAMNAYDNATNPNKTRGGVKKCADILYAFSDTLEGSLEASQLGHLISVTHAVGQYRLVFKQGEPFKPVTLRVHGDPISIIGKILSPDQNPRSYTNIEEFIDMGEHIVKAGLTLRSTDGKSTLTTGSPHEIEKQLSIAKKRVISMCIDAALEEDDFETAYSYVVTRLEKISGRAMPTSIGNENFGNIVSPKSAVSTMDDEWSWRAALQTGKYRRTLQTIKPTHLGNASGNPDIRHLEQRMECLALALRISPPATLHEILNVFRRCEEELESHVKQEAEQEAVWDAQVDEQDMPGGFAATPAKTNLTSRSSRAPEEAPMSLFDLSRASMARAQSGFSALSMLRGNNSTQEAQQPGPTSPNSDVGITVQQQRKRDQLRNVAVGGLASGVGWLIGATPARQEQDEE